MITSDTHRDWYFDETLPEGFESHAWCNDLCPCFVNYELGLRLWIDYSDSMDRADRNNHFNLENVNEIQEEVRSDGTEIKHFYTEALEASTNSWKAVLTKIQLRRERALKRKAPVNPKFFFPLKVENEEGVP